MNRKEIQDQVNELVAEILEVDLGKLSPSFNLLDEADSLALIELAEALEAKFGASLDDEELQDLKTLQDVYDIIEHKLGDG